MNKEDEDAFALSVRRGRMWEDLLKKYYFRDEPVVDLSYKMQVAAGKIKVAELSNVVWDAKAAEFFRKSLVRELERVLDDALAGRPGAAKRFKQFADAAGRVASGVKKRGLNLETRALRAFGEASNHFRELPAQARVLAIVAEELGKRKLPEGTRKAVKRAIAPLYKL